MPSSDLTQSAGARGRPGVSVLSRPRGGGLECFEVAAIGRKIARDSAAAPLAQLTPPATATALEQGPFLERACAPAEAVLVQEYQDMVMIL